MTTDPGRRTPGDLTPTNLESLDRSRKAVEKFNGSYERLGLAGWVVDWMDGSEPRSDSSNIHQHLIWGERSQTWLPCVPAAQLPSQLKLDADLNREGAGVLFPFVLPWPSPPLSFIT